MVFLSGRKRRAGLFLLLYFTLSLILPVVSGGCFPQKAPVISPEAPKVYTIEELAGLASPAVAYIEIADAAGSEWFSFGSGFVVRADGVIVTNYHLLEGAASAVIEVGGQTFSEVLVLGASEEWDLAILKVNASGLTALPLAGSLDQVRLGEQVIAMGNPEGFKGSVSDGIVSTVRRDMGLGFELIQTTAPISKGSSGGPLMNMRGEVIGVNTMTYLTGQNLNFAVPVDLIHSLLSTSSGPGRPVAEIFGNGCQSVGGGFYSAMEGEFAVALSWEESADLDLEIWTEDFELIGTACALGEGSDIINGAHGEEWFVFKGYGSSIQQGRPGSQADFSSGRYIISVYFFGPENFNEGVEATLTIYFPDGRVEQLSREMRYSPPYDQWFAILVDADQQSYKPIDFFLEGELVALLEWDSLADLDLGVWSHQYGEIFFPADFDNGRNLSDGRQGVELFQFASYQVGETSYDFTSGLVDLYVFMDNPGHPVTRAAVTFVTSDFRVLRFEHLFEPDPLGNYWWQVVLELDMDSYSYYEPAPDQLRYYY